MDSSLAYGNPLLSVLLQLLYHLQHLSIHQKPEASLSSVGLRESKSDLNPVLYISSSHCLSFYVTAWIFIFFQPQLA